MEYLAHAWLLLSFFFLFSGDYYCEVPLCVRTNSLQWSSHLPQFYIKFHRVKIISMRCDATNIACGEHGTGRVSVYSRRDIAKKRYRHLEHELGAGVPKKVRFGRLLIILLPPSCCDTVGVIQKCRHCRLSQ